MSETRGKCLVILTALRFSPDYGAAALRSARENGEDVVLCLVVDSRLSSVVAGQLADSGFLAEQLTHDLQDTVTSEQRNRGLDHLKELTSRAEEMGLAAETVVLEGSLPEVVAGVARAHSAGRILVARMDRPHLSRVLFGSEIHRLRKSAPCPVETFDSRGSLVATGGR